MSDVVSYRPPKPPDWAQLRTWIESNGPCSLAAVGAQVRRTDGAWDDQQIREKLEQKKNLFRQEADGRWAAAAPPVRWVPIVPVRRPRSGARPVNPPAAPSRPAAPQRAPATEKQPDVPARKPEYSEPFHVMDGALVSVVFSRSAPAEGQVYESGGRLLLPLPQESEASDIVRPAILAAAKASAEIEVWEDRAEAGTVYRGTRVLLQAAPSTASGRVNLVFAAASDDEGRRTSNLQIAAPVLPPGTTTLSLARPALMDELRLTESQRKLAGLPMPNRSTDRPGLFARAQQLLRAASISNRDWPEFVDWMATKRLAMDQRTTEELLRMALNTPGIAGRSVLGLAAVSLEGREPISVEFAHDFAIALVQSGETPLLQWAAQMLNVATRAAPDDPELMLAQGGLAYEQGKFAAACGWFAKAFADSSLDADAVALQTYLLCAGGVSKSHQDLAKQALAVVDTVLGRVPEASLFGLRTVLADAVELEAVLGRRDSERMRVATLLSVLVLNDEQSAVREWETRCAGEFFKTSEKLELLSVLEDCETAAALLEAYGFVASVVESAFAQKDDNLIRDAIAQLRFMESLLGDDEHHDSKRLQAELAARAAGNPPPINTGKTTASPEVADPHPLRELVIVLVGGRFNTRQRSRTRLLELGAAEVREVAPSSEGRVNANTVSAKVETADLVVCLIDHGGHDTTFILNNLKNAGATFKRVTTAFGPSHVVRDILAAVAK